MWKACRAQEKVLREMMSDQRKRAERRAAYFAQKFADPVQGVRIMGQPTKIYYDTSQYNMNESMENLMPWQGHTDNMIDRFDVRAMLDYIPPYNPKLAHPLSTEDQELEVELNFNRYKEIVEMTRTGAEEDSVIRDVYNKIEDSIVDAASFKGPPPAEEKKLAVYGSVGFTYKDEDSGGVGAEDDQGPSDEDDEDEEEHSEEEKKLETYEGIIADMSTQREKEINQLASSEYGIPNFCRQIRLETKQGDTGEMKRPQNPMPSEKYKNPGAKRRSRRERRRERENNRDTPYPRTHAAYERRGSPTYDDYEPSSRSKKDDSEREGKIEFITEFTVGDEDNTDDNFGASSTLQESVYRAPSAPAKPEAKPDAKKGEKEKAVEEKLTPQERLKMKMRMALNKTIEKDTVQLEKKKHDQEREKHKKAEELRELRRKYERSSSRSPSRSRSRSRSRPRSRNRASRSRSPPRDRGKDGPKATEKERADRGTARNNKDKANEHKSYEKDVSKNGKDNGSDRERDRDQDRSSRDRSRDISRDRGGRRGGRGSRSRSRSRSRDRKSDQRRRRSRSRSRSPIRRGSQQSCRSRSRSRSRDRRHTNTSSSRSSSGRR